MNNIHFSIKQDTEVENRSIISTTDHIHTQKKKQKKKTHHCKINTFIAPLRIKKKRDYVPLIFLDSNNKTCTNYIFKFSYQTNNFY